MINDHCSLSMIVDRGQGTARNRDQEHGPGTGTRDKGRGQETRGSRREMEELIRTVAAGMARGLVSTVAKRPGYESKRFFD